MKLPKSVPDSKEYLVWAFPGLLAYGVASLPSASWQGFIAVIVVLGVVFTGWLSFAVVPEASYNDLLFVCDIALLSSYGLLIYFGARLSSSLSLEDMAIWLVSGAIFFFYAMWDFSALLASDTRAVASALHLRRFGFICLTIAFGFFVSATIVNGLLRGSPAVSEVWMIPIRGAWLFAWVLIIAWWHYGRLRAAILDGRI